jgi:hypothetical protein
MAIAQRPFVKALGKSTHAIDAFFLDAVCSRNERDPGFFRIFTHKKEISVSRKQSGSFILFNDCFSKANCFSNLASFSSFLTCSSCFCKSAILFSVSFTGVISVLSTTVGATSVLAGLVVFLITLLG